MRILYALLISALLAPSLDAQLVWNQAASFSGTSSYVVVYPSASVNITGSFTLEAWINPNSIAADYQGIISKGTTAMRHYSLNFAAAPLSDRIEIATNGGQKIRSRTAIAPGRWTHVAGVYDNATNTFSVYLNGVLDTSSVVTGAAPADGPADSVFVGRTSAGARMYAGLIDDARIWNRALTVAEIRKWMRTELGASTGVYSGLVLSLLFQSSINNTIFNLYDFSGLANIASNRGASAASLAGGPSAYGTPNDCVYLDGAGSYLAGGTTTALEISGSFTLECWVYPTALSSAQILISKRALTSNINGYDMYLSAGRVAIRTNGITRLLGQTVIPIGQWSHVAATYNVSNGAVAVYVNGRPDGTGTASAALVVSTDSLLIGHGFNADFVGYIDEVRIIPVALTQQEIRSFMYRSMDMSNAPASMTGYNLDGLAYANTNANGAPQLQFRGNAGFACVSTVSNQPLSPLNRADAQNFPQGYHMKQSDRRIPQTGTSGLMVPDSLFISESLSISDVNLFIGANHTYDSDLSIALVGPGGDSVNVYQSYYMLDQNDNIVTLFDDQADSSMANSGIFTSMTPRIRPRNSLNAGFAGRSALGWWKLKITDLAGGDTGRVYSWGVQINNQVLVGVNEIAIAKPLEFSLDQNFPNPFNPETKLRFRIPVQSSVRLTVFDILGREVRTLVNEVKNPGTYEVVFDARTMASGTYFCRMEAGTFVETKKILLLK
jgi:subtilisin-like proprotein convertase family protein